VSARSPQGTLAAATLRGRPVAALQVSFADPRGRHRGLHHSVVLRDVYRRRERRGPALDDAHRAVLWDALRAARLEDRHQLVEADGRPALEELRRRSVEVRSMGRSPDDDPAFFLAAGAAGVLAGRMAAGSRRYRDLNR
jgi:hypothetical protein